MWIGVLSACYVWSVYHVYAAPAEGRIIEGCEQPCVWVLGIEPMPSETAASTCNF